MPNPHQILVRNQIRQAGFPTDYRQQAEKKILDAIWNIRVQRRIAKNLYSACNNSKIGERPSQVGAGRPSKSAQTTYLISVLNTVWMRGMSKKPSVNRRDFRDSRFVIFAEPILMSHGIFNIIDKLNDFKAYRKRLSQIIDRRTSV